MVPARSAQKSRPSGAKARAVAKGAGIFPRGGVWFGTAQVALRTGVLVGVGVALADEQAPLGSGVRPWLAQGLPLAVTCVVSWGDADEQALSRSRIIASQVMKKNRVGAAFLVARLTFLFPPIAEND